MKYALLSLTLLWSANAFAAGPEDKLSPTDVNAILMVSNEGCTGCVYPGVDVNAKTVEVLPTDLAARDEWISIMAEGKETDPFHGQDRHGLSKPSMDGHEFYGRGSSSAALRHAEWRGRRRAR